MIERVVESMAIILERNALDSGVFIPKYNTKKSANKAAQPPQGTRRERSIGYDAHL